jgi:Type I restriction enzyme R protein N terminus (HSDR_N)
MGLSKPSRQIYDPIRKIWVPAGPEELVRQSLIQKMVQNLGFPAHSLAVEVDLRSLPHIDSKVPERRADIICFAQGIHPDYLLYPLLLVECKRGKASQEALHQLVGYNYYVKAAFVAVAGHDEIFVARQGKDAEAISFLPTYQDLVRVCSL